MKSLFVQSSPIRRQLGEKRVCEKRWLLTFLEQSVKLVEERRDMHNNARANDARDGDIDQSLYHEERGVGCRLSSHEQRIECQRTAW